MGRGRRAGFGRGFWFGVGPGRGTGNRYPFCRNFPGLTRWWSTGAYPAPYYGCAYPFGGRGGVR
jgi:hypothetical protein